MEENWIAGSYDSAALGFSKAEAGSSKGFFLLNASTNVSRNFRTFDELVPELRQRGLHPHLRPFDEVFREYRNTWFDKAAAAWALGVPLCALVAFAVYVLRLRKRAEHLVAVAS